MHMDLNFTKVLSMTLYRSQIWMETPRNTKHMHMWKPYDVSHAFSCPSGGYVIITHNKIRDATASMFKEVTSGVETEPMLQPLPAWGAI
jgi:hypothetical protein